VAPSFLAPPDTPDVAYEFYAPFAHVEGKLEWCRIRSSSHGAFDSFILVGRRPVAVYVSSEAGERFLAERFPEVERHRVEPSGLRIEERDEGRTVVGSLTARAGPVRAARMTLAASPQVKPRAVPYGGRGEGVWGSKRWTCWGVDLALEGVATGAVEWSEGYVEKLDRAPCIVTLGSFGRLASL
jgi:hypothetical protein